MRSTIWFVVVAVVLAACGGNDSDGVASIDDVVTTSGEGTTTTTAAGSNASDEEAVLEFAACMRQRDIDFPDPIVDSDGNVGFDLPSLSNLADLDDTVLEDAFESCVPLLAGVSFGFERVFDAEFQDDVVVFAGCMRENGIDMPDPDFGAIVEGRPLFPGWQPELDDPDFEAALEACEDLLPGIPGIAGN